VSRSQRGRTLVVALLLALISSAAANPVISASSLKRATRATFVGTWYGHTRLLKIKARGRAKESISDGCCDRVIALRLRLSHAHGSSRRASIRARVTAVQIYDPSESPPVHRGDVGRLKLRNGVISEPLTGTNYCDLKADRRGACGA
jgi:hypothetical protein